MDFRNKKLVRTVQIVYGLLLIYFPLSGMFSFLQFLPQPSYNESALAFISALFATGYLLQVMLVTFIACGLAFVFNRWSALGAVLLVPVTLNIFLFHAFLDIAGTPLALTVILPNIYLIYAHWDKYKMLRSKN